MLWEASALIGYHIEATDGPIGSVSDLLFDDQSWTSRWLVVDTGKWLPGRQVLLPISSLGLPNAGLQHMPVRLTRQQVRDAPGAASDLPVSRQMERHLPDHYGTEAYWANGSNAVPLTASPYLMEARHHFPGEGIVANMSDAHLRSIVAVTGYHICATDGDIGHVHDLLVGDAGWRIACLSVDTHNWWPGARVLILPRLVREVDWSGSLIHISTTRQMVRDSPPYDDAATVDGAYAEAMSAHYGFGLFAV